MGKYRGGEVAVKQCTIDKDRKELVGQIQKEIKLMTALKSPYIVSFFGTAV